MSVQFGRWNFDGKPVDRDYLEKVKPVIAPYGPDDGGSYREDKRQHPVSCLPHHKGISPRNAAARHGIRRHPHLGRSLGQSRQNLIRGLRRCNDQSLHGR